MNEIVNHKTISFCWPFGPRDSGPVGKPIMPHLRRYQGFAVVHYSVTLDALYLGHPRLSLNWGFILYPFLIYKPGAPFFQKGGNPFPGRFRAGDLGKAAIADLKGLT